jgi:hypothetical protein
MYFLTTRRIYFDRDLEHDDGWIFYDFGVVFQTVWSGSRALVPLKFLAILLATPENLEAETKPLASWINIKFSEVFVFRRDKGPIVVASKGRSYVLRYHEKLCKQIIIHTIHLILFHRSRSNAPSKVQGPFTTNILLLGMLLVDKDISVSSLPSLHINNSLVSFLHGPLLNPRLQVLLSN